MEGWFAAAALDQAAVEALVLVKLNKAGHSGKAAKAIEPSVWLARTVAL